MVVKVWSRSSKEANDEYSPSAEESAKREQKAGDRGRRRRGWPAPKRKAKAAEEKAQRLAAVRTAVRGRSRLLSLLP